MRPARGDSRPCTSAGCDGTMQFVRESDNDARTPARRAAASAPTGLDRMGWMCSVEPGHFSYGD